MSIRHRSSRATLLACLAIPLLLLATPARADDDALAPYRDRFRLGMEKYKSGGIAEAIRVWSAIYEEIGPKRGYRLAFNLGRAYDTNGEATRAAERYRSFLDEAHGRVTAGETLEPLVSREVEEAEQRLSALNLEHGRIQIPSMATATLAQVDDTDPRLGAFTAYVAAGKHVVTFAPGTDDTEKVEITVAAGELVIASPTHAPTPRDEHPLPSVDPVTSKHVTTHPFRPVVLYAGGVATAVSILAPVFAYAHAYSIIDTFNTSPVNSPAKTNAYAEYSGARSLAYGMLAVPISLAAATGALTTWYFAATKDEEVFVSASLAPFPGGGAATLSGRF
jgi:hypothetical protein